MEVAALVILVLFSLIGFAAIFFTTFGTLIILIGSVLYAALTGFSAISVKTLSIIATLYLAGEVLEYVFVIVGAKKLGASNAAVVGAIVGGVFGAILGSVFFGVGLIAGTFLGVFLGAFLVEFLLQKDLVKSLKAAAGGLLGRVGSVVAKIVIAIVMFAIITRSIL